MTLPVEAWLAARNWQAFDFQREVWAAMAAGQSGLLHATTGSGKTYAVWLGLLALLLAKHGNSKTAPPLSVIWVTPMRALAADTGRALQEPMRDLAPSWTLGLRTGDTAASERAKQDRRYPTVLVTTPESLSLMLSRENARETLSGVVALVCDEWHELIASKRGVQLQLALARLREFNQPSRLREFNQPSRLREFNQPSRLREFNQPSRVRDINPGLLTWGLSATLGNSEQAMQVLCGLQGDLAKKLASKPVLVRGRMDKKLQIDTLIPPDPGRYSWAGHLGARMQQPVVDEIAASTGTTLVFTNVRSQAEIWYQLLLAAKPEWAGEIALHHGSLDKEVRAWVEAGLKAGSLRAVVATSSLDLGVDFLPVERVLQIGSPKGIARLVQRAGRSGHAPGRTSRVTVVPTHTMELLEAAAARSAALAGRVEPRESPEKPLDVLVQHLVTVALGGGFEKVALFKEVTTSWAYRNLSQDEFDWALAFCERGGHSLTAYTDYHRIKPDDNGIYRVPDRGIAKRHRLSIGTIVSDASITVKFMNGNRIGVVEESFIARLRKGDCFFFAGRLLEFIRVHEMAAQVKKATKNKGTVPSWGGSKMAISAELGQAVLEMMQRAASDDFLEPELQAARPMLQTQARLSRLPTPTTLLVEQYTSKEGHHLYLHPFAGRSVHLGLASLLAWRLARDQPNSFSLSVNDYGFELLAPEPFDIAPVLNRSVFAVDNLLPDVLASLNSSELAQRRFREIARVAGLVFSGYPGAPKSMKQVQASSGLFFEVFKKYDPDNLLLGQAQTEVLSQELDIARLTTTLTSLASKRIDFVQLAQPSPLSLPLMVERFREALTTEQLSARLERMLEDMEASS